MPLKFKEHEITCDNTVVTNKLPDAKNKITTLIGVDKVLVGVDDPTKQVIKVNPVTGVHYQDNDTYAQQIFNLSTQVRGCWFALDLETGRKNGKSWYPGSKMLADTVGNAVEIKEEMSDTSITLIILKDATVTVLDTLIDSSKDAWYQVQYDTIVGYVRSAYLNNFRYVDRGE